MPSENIPNIIGVIGTGTMGRGIMQVAVEGGMHVVAYDARDNAAAEARDFVRSMLKRAAEKGKITFDQAEERGERISLAHDLADLSQLPLVVEAIAEDLEIKQQLFAALEDVVGEDAILASNTSSLSITAIAAACRKPERVAGFHFFNPVPLMQLVEVIGGLRTAPAVLDTLVEVGRRMNREPLRVADGPGFLVNHIGRGYMPESVRLLEEGIATVEDIDAVMTESAGFRMGPFALLDLVGLDVAYPVMKSIYEQFMQEPMYRPSRLIQMRAQAGLLGRKSGSGFYAHEAGAPASTAKSPALQGRMPSSVWISQAEPTGHSIVTDLIAQLPVVIEKGDAPSPDALCFVTPIGQDATATVVEQGLDPARTIAIDTLFDIGQRCTLMVTPATCGDYRAAAQALLGSKVSVTTIKDSPGFVAQRVVAMIVNVACAIADQNIASPGDIDIGARLGLNYPVGPLELGDRIGARRVLQILEALHDHYGDPRYRPTSWLKKRAALNLSLLHPGEQQ